MRVLVTYGSERGGTEGIAKTVAEAIRAAGHEVDLVAASDVGSLGAYDGVIVGGALYANRWHRAARRFVDRHELELRRVPVWFFSSGPLDDSAERQTIAPVPQVQIRMERVGAQGHVTFGGRLSPDARGFPASAMAKTHAGDWRDPVHVRAWTGTVAEALPTARPKPVVPQPGRSLWRLVLHGAAGWVVFRGSLTVLAWMMGIGAARVLGLFVAAIVFGVVARYYFIARGARPPLPTALAFAGIVAALDLIVSGLVQGSYGLFASAAGFWAPLAIVLVVTWATGAILSTLPWPKQAQAR